MPISSCCLLYLPSGCYSPWEAQRVPAKRVSATVTIVDSVAQVALEQRFTNDQKDKLEATYSFPVPASAAIFAFEFERGDGTKVIGVSKEKEQAKKEYDQAISEGKTAALGAEQTKDLFEISVGNVASKETIIVRLSYAVELQDDERPDETKFVLPASTFPRYGNPSHHVSPSIASSTPTSISVSIQQCGAIKKVSCPSAHPIGLELGRSDLTKAAADVPEANLASVTLSQEATLDKDFILTILSQGLDSPRATIEARPSFEKPDTVALALTLVPRFSLPTLPAAEWIFVVDRSGSMGGAPMELAKKALLIAVKGLPSKGTQFNIVSFGSSFAALFPKSQDYTESSLKKATKDIDSMSANYGGTEIRSALQHAFSIRNTTKPTNVLLFTDGGSYDVEQTYQTVRDAVAKADNDAPVRVFTFGIGSGVSTELVQGIARHGQGTALFAAENESMSGKIGRLIKAARAPAVTDLSIDWLDGAPLQPNDEFEIVDETEKQEKAPAYEAQPVKIDLFQQDMEVDAKEETGPAKDPVISASDLPYEAIQQAPVKLRSLFPGIRYSVFAIIEASALKKGMPQQLKVTGRVQGSGQEVELVIPVLQASSFSAAPIHVLAARKLVESAEDGLHTFPSKIADDATKLAAYLKAKIVHLGTTYSITSRHTSFVAVDERAVPASQPVAMDTVVVDTRRMQSYESMPSRGAMPSPAGAVYRSRAAGGGGASPKFKKSSAPTSGFGGIASSMVGAATSLFGSPSPNARGGGQESYASFGAPPPPPAPARRSAAMAPSAFDLAAPAAAPVALKQGFGGPPVSASIRRRKASSSDDNEEGAAAQAEPTNSEDVVALLARLQSFDGHWKLEDKVLRILKTDAKAAQAEVANQSKEVVATVLVLRYLKKQLGSLSDSWEGIFEKGQDWLEGQGVWDQVKSWVN